MAVILEGGCRVSEMREGAAVSNGTLRVWHQVGRAVGAQAISLRVLELAPGVSPEMCNESCDEILYVLDAPWERRHPACLNVNNEHVGENEPVATIFIDDRAYEVGPATGIYLRPGQAFSVDNPGPEPLVLISSQCPEPVQSASETAATESRIASSSLGGRPAVAADSTVYGTFIFERKERYVDSKRA